MSDYLHESDGKVAVDTPLLDAGDLQTELKRIITYLEDKN